MSRGRGVGIAITRASPSCAFDTSRPLPPPLFLQAQEAYAAKIKAGVGQTYGKAEALRARGDAKGAAALYAEAARSTAEFKALPSMETLGAYPSLLATAAAALDAAKIEVMSS